MPARGFSAVSSMGPKHTEQEFETATPTLTRVELTLSIVEKFMLTSISIYASTKYGVSEKPGFNLNL